MDDEGGPAAPLTPSPGPSWSGALVGILAGTCVLVPCLFSTRLAAAFAVPKLAALWVALTLCLLIVAVGVIVRGDLPRGVRPAVPLDVALALFLLLGVAAFGASGDRRQSLFGERLQYQGLLTVLLYAAFFWVARAVLTDARRLRLLTIAVTVGATVVAGYAVLQRAGIDPVWDGYLPMGRAFSSIGQPNALAAYLVMAIPLAASLLTAATPARAAIALSLVAMVIALLFTLSRGGYLALPVALAILALGVRGDLRANARRLGLGMAGVLCAALAIVTLVPPAHATVTRSWHRATSSGDVGADASLRFHLDAWNVALHIVADHPLLGTGPETFPDVFPGYSHAELPTERASALDAYRVESPHNVYLAIAAGSGIPALLAYLGMVTAFAAAVARAARRARSREMRLALVALLAACAGHLVTDAFMTADLTGTWLFWVLMGGGIGVVSSGTRHASPFFD